jgi:transcriptional regulator of heat shock response
VDLTKRQRRILRAIVSEFVETGIPVGSLTLAEKHDIGVSPATLRAEMSKLVDEGFLFKEHSSAGRIPTTLGFRYFLDEMLKEEKVDKLKETQIREKIFQKRFDRNKFIRQAVKELADLSGLAALSLVDDVVFTSGVGKLLLEPEFENLQLLQSALEIIESETMLASLFQKFSRNGNLKILIGDDIGIEALSNCGIVCTPYNFFRGGKGYLAAVGPKRMRYSEVIPAVRTVADFIEEAISGW